MLSYELRRLLGDVVSIRPDTLQDNTYAVETRISQELKHYSSVDIHITIYPYSRQINANDISFRPYDDYVNDILEGRKTIYTTIPQGFDKLFGLLLGAAFVIVFYFLNPQDLTSVQSTAAIIGIYFVGKEVWKEIENSLIWITRSSPVRYILNQYSYQKQEKTTLGNYLAIARLRRYGIPFLLPRYLDLIKQSNSQTIKLGYKTSDINFEQKEDSARIINIENTNIDDKFFADKNILIGLKYSLNRNFLGVQFSTECFQSIDGVNIGCLDNEEIWHPNSAFIRTVCTIGSIKFYISSKIIKEAKLLEVKY